MKKLIFLSALFFYVQIQSFLCPKTYTNIKIGDTEDQVRAACGEPLTTQSQKVSLNNAVQLDIWQYKSRRYFDNKRNGRRVDSPQVTFTLLKDKLVSIQSDGVQLPAITTCGQHFKVGQSNRTAILSACGKPNFQTTREDQVYQGRAQATTWTYQFGTYQPKKILKFYDGKLRHIE